MSEQDFDAVIVGGGITGAAVFSQAASAGLRVLLLEKETPGAATTGVSSGLLHGGLRYLPYDAGTSSLSCREAGLLRGRHPDLVRRQTFLWPVYRGRGYGLDTVEALLEYYDMFAGLKGGFRHVRLGARETLEVEGSLEPKGLLGSVSFDEWSVDAQGLVLRHVKDGCARGGKALAFSRVTSLEVARGAIRSVGYADGQGRGAQASGRVVVNATGPWAEETAKLASARMVRLSLRKGSHLVLEGHEPRHALIFRGIDGRYIGLYPRPGGAWVGPTDTNFSGRPDGPLGAEDDRELLWRSVSAVLPSLDPVGSRTVAGVRPIIRRSGPGPLSRDYRIYDHAEEGISNLVTVTGGKLTIHRVMAEETCRLLRSKLGAKTSAQPEGERAPFLSRWGHRHPFLGAALSAGLLVGFWLRHWLLRLSGGGREGLRLFRETYG